jgi:hypothetical protein
MFPVDSEVICMFDQFHWKVDPITFHPYQERPKRSWYVICVTILVSIVPGIRTGFQLDLDWDSNLAWPPLLLLCTYMSLFKPFFIFSIVDVDINTSDTSTPTHNQIFGPITRARVRQLNNQVSLFLASYSSYLDNGNMSSILLLRNDGQERNGVTFTPVAFRFQNSSSL